MEPTVGCPPTFPEHELCRNVKDVLPRDSDLDCFKKGMLRWTLHRKVQKNPANSLSLVWGLIKELEKAEKWESRRDIIPLLHTLMYAILQTAYIPDELYKRVYNFCKRLLTYPHPYCAVGLSYTRRIQAERSSPGLMYQRMLTAEQSLKNEHYPFQERVFVLADLEIFGSLGQVLMEDIETLGSGGTLGHVDYMSCVVQHAIQAALGAQQCSGQKLAEALKDMGQNVEAHFQEVLAALEQSAAEEGGRGERGALKARLQQLYSRITDAEPTSGGPLCDCPLPNPEMSFHLWTEDVDIWRLLSKWFRSSSSSEQFPLSQEQEDFELGDCPSDPSPSETTRHSVMSVMSNDSGIEKDLPPGAELAAPQGPGAHTSWEAGKSEPDPSKLSRTLGFRIKPSVKDSMALMQDSLDDPSSLAGGGGDRGRAGSGGATLQRRAGSSALLGPLAKQRKQLTARIVVMGDDRALGRLAREYFFFRKREARRIFLTLKINLQFYYIPVCGAKSPGSPVKNKPHKWDGEPCALGSYLSMVDPWYNTNISSLGSMILKLAQMRQSKPEGPKKDPFISDVISYYIRMAQQPVFFTVYFVKIFSSGAAKEPVEDVFLTHLDIDFPEFRQISASAKDRRKSSAEGFGPYLSIKYNKVTLSGRDVEKGFSVRTLGAQINAIPSNEAEDLNCLTLTLKECTAKSKNNAPIRTSHVKVTSAEHRAFAVTLDRDGQRTYKDVQSLEVSPCLDPGYYIQKSVKSKYKLGEEQDGGLSKYMKKGLHLPMNTFAGIVT